MPPGTGDLSRAAGAPVSTAPASAAKSGDAIIRRPRAGPTPSKPRPLDGNVTTSAAAGRPRRICRPPVRYLRCVRESSTRRHRHSCCCRRVVKVYSGTSVDRRAFSSCSVDCLDYVSTSSDYYIDCDCDASSSFVYSTDCDCDAYLSAAVDYCQNRNRSYSTMSNYERDPAAIERERKRRRRGEAARHGETEEVRR